MGTLRAAAACLVLGAAAGRLPGAAGALVAGPAALALTVGVLGAALGIAWTGTRRRAGAAVCAIAALAGALRAADAGPGDLAMPDWPVADVRATADAAPEPLAPPADGTSGVTWVFAATAGDVTARVALELPAGERPPPVRAGDRVRVLGRLRPREGASNPGGRPGRPDPPVQVDAASVRVGRRPADSAAILVRRAGERLRDLVRTRLRAACGPEAGGVLACVLVGDRSGLDPESARALRESGTAHLLAVSGLHLVALVGLATALARRVVPERVRRATGVPAVALAVLAYAATCRFETPVVRAGVFVVVTAIGRAVRRRTSPLDHLALAAIVVVGADPEQVADAGFHLSFGAVAGLTLLTSRFREALFPNLRILLRFPEAMPRARLRRLRRFADALSVSCAAQASTAPAAAAAFGTAQAVGPLANLVAVPAFAVLLPVALGLAVCGDVVAPVTVPVAQVATSAFLGVAGGCAALPFGHVAFGRPPPLLLAAGIALLVAGARLPAWRRPHLAVPVAAWALVAFAPAAVAARAGPEIVALDVGHGLAVIVRAADGTALLYDAGGRAPGLGDRTIVPALRALGVRRLELVCVSHEDADHCSAVADVVRDVDVGRVLVPVGFGASPLARSMLDACRAAGVPVEGLLDGDRVRVGGIDALALHPSRPAVGGAENPDSLVLRVAASGPDGPLTALLPGDVDGDSLGALVARSDLPQATVLVLPHHGRGLRAPQARLAAALGARVLVASSSDAATVPLREAWVTGACGAVRVAPDGRPAAWPWP